MTAPLCQSRIQNIQFVKSHFLFHFVYAWQTFLLVLVKKSLSLLRRLLLEKLFHLLFIPSRLLTFDCLHSFLIWLKFVLVRVKLLNLVQFISAPEVRAACIQVLFSAMYHLKSTLLPFASDLLKLALRFLEQGSEKVDNSQK